MRNPENPTNALCTFGVDLDNLVNPGSDKDAQ